MGGTNHVREKDGNAGWQRSCGARSARGKRSDIDLPDHAVVADGRMVGSVVGGIAPQHLGHSAAGGRNAERGGSLGSLPRSAAGGSIGHHLHRLPGTPAHDPQHVQNSGRTHQHSHARNSQKRGRPRALHLRRPLRRHGRAQHRLGHALLGDSAGIHGQRAHRANGDPRRQSSRPPLLRRLPHQPRRNENRRNPLRRHARLHRRRPRARTQIQPPHARRALHPRHRAKPRRLLPVDGRAQPLLRRHARHRPASDGQIRENHRQTIPPLRLLRQPRSRASHNHHGLRRGGSARSRRPPEPRGRKSWPNNRAPLPPLRHHKIHKRPPRDSQKNSRPRPQQRPCGQQRAPLRRRQRSPQRLRHHHSGRPLRPLLQRLHPGHGQRSLRRTPQTRPQRRLHHRHRRRRHLHQPPLRPVIRHRKPQNSQMPLLRPRLRRHSGSQQKLHQNHRPGNRPLRPGLLQLRLQKIRRNNRKPPALRSRPHIRQLPHKQSQLPGLPRLQLPRKTRHPEKRGRRRNIPPQRPLRPRTNLGQTAENIPAKNNRQTPQTLRHRRR